jgi:hypothetical protein
MRKTITLALTFILICLALPALGKTYKNTSPVACTEIWPAVQIVLSNPDNYNVTGSDDAKMTADYDVKHSAHGEPQRSAVAAKESRHAAAQGDRLRDAGGIEL